MSSLAFRLYRDFLSSRNLWRIVVCVMCVLASRLYCRYRAPKDLTWRRASHGQWTVVVPLTTRSIVGNAWEQLATPSYCYVPVVHVVRKYNVALHYQSLFSETCLLWFTSTIYVYVYVYVYSNRMHASRIRTARTIPKRTVPSSRAATRPWRTELQELASSPLVPNGRASRDVTLRYLRTRMLRISLPPVQ